MTDREVDQSVLVIGFSVVAEDSLVEVARRQLAIKSDGRDILVTKVGLGGWYPFLLRYIHDRIIGENPVSHVILEVSTSSLRSMNRSHDEHHDSMMSMLENCARRNIPVSILDLPRQDIDNEDDWMFDMHLSLSQMYGLGYRRVPLSDGLLRDVVHPTDKGKEIYGMALLDMISSPPECSGLRSLADSKPRYESLPAMDCMRDKSGRVRPFSRSGYMVNLVEISENTQVSFDLPEGSNLCGYTVLFGPETGYLTFKCTGFENKSTAYDAFSYYERLSATQFDARSSHWASFYQHRDRPNIALNKGEPSLLPRKGYIGHFFLKKQS